MAFKFFAVFAFLATAAAVIPQHHYQPAHLVKHVEHEAPAEYNFEYSVQDDHTGDVKSQHETRQGDNVQGFYTVNEADGYRRIVHYTADEKNGFNAKVEREYTGHHIPQPVVARKVYAAPAVHHVAPVVHHAPAVQHGAYHAPAVHHVAPTVKHVSYQTPAVHHHASARYTHTPVVHQAPAVQHVAYHAPTVKHVAPVVYAAPAQYVHHGGAHSSVSVQSYGVNYQY